MSYQRRNHNAFLEVRAAQQALEEAETEVETHWLIEELEAVQAQLNICALVARGDHCWQCEQEARKTLQAIVRKAGG